jgi:6-pyruvoyltetrahydropterin/6-carboxytetrahydropterin synthase
MNFSISQTYHIESSRFLPLLKKDHPCSRMHGHSFKITLTLVGPLQPEGWVMDYNDINLKARPFLELIDHRVLNEVPGLENPTTEILSRWLYEKLKIVLPELKSVSISETHNTDCTYPV